MTPEHWQHVKNLVNSALEQSAEQRSVVLQQSCAEDLSLRRGAEALLSFHEQATRNLASPAKLSSAGTMSPERWQQVEQLFQSALELSPAERAAFLAKACGDDAELKQEVEALLVFQTGMSGVIQGAVHEAAGLLANTNEKARFAPGMTLNKRYRIIGQLGKGGMGEVYRADDLKLGHPVALKFLTEKLSNDKAMLARFHSEVAMAHRVTHPNVCRVHDIGEVTTSSGKLHFLSMEYVDGEDLSSLLRRIGRLPADKAVEIANQLCAGLAAAHEAGVLHRDLKPANVMLDGKGRVRITDFGLAGFADTIRNEEVFAGTPAYMSPEQFAGKEVTTKSDIYALGLVLYEIFTGKRVFEANSLQELQRLHESSSPTNPSNWVKDIDPLVERVILRCLEKDPGRRLASAKQVADALPGGDPLAAALAMGETPSPEMVAAAGSKTGMKPAYAVACLVAIIVGLITTAFLGKKVNIPQIVFRENSADALTHKAREIIQRLGYTDPPLDHASGFYYDPLYFNYVEQNFEPNRRWELFTKSQPSSLGFWYRQSPRYLNAQVARNGGWIKTDDPPMIVSGMINVQLDSQGRLIKFRAVPPRKDESRETSVPDWSTIFTAAGLDLARFTTTEPQWTSLATSDARMAWTGTYPNLPEIPLRVEAATWRGKPVYFELIWPWTLPARMQARPETTGERVAFLFGLSVILALLFIAAMLARYNFKQERGDRRGAFRLAAFGYSVVMLIWVLGADHTPVFANEFWSFLLIANGQALLGASALWLFYLALEPYARRRWPVTLISWGRLLSGNLRDPLVGRDLLIGVCYGVSLVLVNQLWNLSIARFDAIHTNAGQNMMLMLGVRKLIAGVFLGSLIESLLTSLFFFFLFLLLRVLTRRQWLAASIWYLIWVLPGPGTGPGTASKILGLLAGTMTALLFLTVTLRSGLLALAFGMFVASLIREITTDLSAWYGGASLAMMIVVLALAIYAFHTSLGGQKVFAGKLLEE